MMQWIGPIDPERFDLAAHARKIAAALRRRKPRAAKKKSEAN
jgi:hypothetical protein